MKPQIFAPVGAVSSANVAILDHLTDSFSVTCAVILSAGASLTYSLEYTIEPISNPSSFDGIVWTAANANWLTVPGMSALTATNSVTILGPCTAVRLNVTGWVSGTARLEVLQAGGGR